MAWRQELVGQSQIVLMIDQKGEFLLWISLSAVTPQKETVICASLIIVVLCERPS
jgi:hypothetical protein